MNTSLLYLYDQSIGDDVEDLFNSAVHEGHFDNNIDPGRKMAWLREFVTTSRRLSVERRDLWEQYRNFCMQVGWNYAYNFLRDAAGDWIWNVGAGRPLDIVGLVARKDKVY